jgi:hypothetical protein
METENKKINFRIGLDRLYLVLTFGWFLSMYILFLSSTFDSMVNLYTDDLYRTILVHLLVLLAPFIIYISLVFLFKLIHWIVSGFLQPLKGKSHISLHKNEGYFAFLKKYRKIILLILGLLVGFGIFLSFAFTSYESYSDRPSSPTFRTPYKSSR